MAGLWQVPNNNLNALSGNQPLSLLDTNFASLAIMPQYATSASSGANALSITVPLTFGAYAAGMRFAFTAGATCSTGGVTLAVNGLGNIPVLKNNFALAAGDIQQFGFYEVYYDANNNFQLQSPTATEYLFFSQTVPNLTASVDFTSGLGTAFNTFRFTLTDITFSNSATKLAVRVTRTGGAPFVSGFGDYTWAMCQTTSAGISPTGATEGQMVICNSTSTAANTALNGEVFLYNPAGTTAIKMIKGSTGHLNSGGTLVREDMVGYCVMGTAGSPLSAVNGVSFLPLAGTLGTAAITGRITMYGIRSG